MGIQADFKTLTFLHDLATVNSTVINTIILIYVYFRKGIDESHDSSIFCFLKELLY